MNEKNYFDCARAYYTFLKTSTQKEQCSVSIVCENVDVKQELMDGFLFSGALIYDGQVKDADGYISIKENKIELKNCRLEDLKFESYKSNPNGTVKKK